MSKEKQSFEEMMKELENIVQKLDNEAVSLEESLDLYQRGMKLSANCDSTLKEAEKKVNELMQEEVGDKEMKKLQMNKLINIINTSLNKSIQSSPLKTNLEESMKYSLNAGGKRIRPVILLLTLKMLNKDYQQGLNSALALK